MRSFNNRDTAPSHHASEHSNTPVARNYREIAEILAEREGAAISPAEVEQVCRAAERKLGQAVRGDPVIDQWLETTQREPGGRSRDVGHR